MAGGDSNASQERINDNANKGTAVLAPEDASNDVTVVNFVPRDPENPRNFSPLRKWAIVTAITLVDLTVSWGASGFSPATKDFEQSFGVSSEVGTLGLSLYVLGLALGPMTIAPLSEYYGRNALYIVPFGIYLLLLIGTALVPNVAGFLVLRVLSGIFSSVTIANFGGTIADLWPRHQVGPAMSLFLWAAVGGSPTGYFLLSFVAGYRGWRDVIWAIFGMSAGLWLVLTVVLIAFNNETRPAVLLRRRATRLSKEHPTTRFDVPDEFRRKSLGDLFSITLTRPFRFLFTEAIIIFAALYNGYLYGLSYLFNGAFNLVFGSEGYGFGVIGVGLSFLGFIVGVSLGPVANIWQERHFQKCIHRGGKRQASGHNFHDPNGRSIPQDGLADPEEPEEDDNTFQNMPETRLRLGQIAGLLFPISLFFFAWTSVPSYHIHWIVPIIATALFGFSFYTLILMSYMYVEESYMTFSASALAGVGLVRNLFGAGFPLFGTQMFETLGYNWAGTLLALLALLLTPIPFILQGYGPRLRAKSPFARQHMDDVDSAGFEG